VVPAAHMDAVDTTHPEPASGSEAGRGQLPPPAANSEMTRNLLAADGLGHDHAATDGDSAGRDSGAAAAHPEGPGKRLKASDGERRRTAPRQQQRPCQCTHVGLPRHVTHWLDALGPAPHLKPHRPYARKLPRPNPRVMARRLCAPARARAVCASDGGAIKGGPRRLCLASALA
jgi:hypothetical protein